MTSESPAIAIDMTARTARVGSEPVPMGDRTFDLLAALVEDYPDIVPKDRLSERVLPGEVVSDERLAQRVSMLRKALRDADHFHIEIRNEHGRGYALSGPPPVPSSAEPSRTADTGASNRWRILAAIGILFAIGAAAFGFFADETPTVLVDPDTGSIRIASPEGEVLAEPGRATVDGREVLIETTFAPDVVAGSPEAAAALCSLSAEMSQFVIPPPAPLVASLEGLRESIACSDS